MHEREYHGGAEGLRRPAFSGVERTKRANSLRLSAISPKKCKQPKTLRNFRERSAQSLRLSAISAWGCKQPETSRNFRDWTANSLRRSAIFITRMQKNAKCLKRPAIFGSRAHKKCKQPETVGDFIKKVQTAQDVPQFSGAECSEPETVRDFSMGGASSLRRPAIFGSGTHKKWKQPETLGFHQKKANSPRHSAIFVSGVLKA